MFRLKHINPIQLGVVLSIIFLLVNIFAYYEILPFEISWIVKLLIVFILLSSNFWVTTFGWPSSFLNYLNQIYNALLVHFSFILFLTVSNIILHHCIDTGLKEIIVKTEILKAQEHIETQERRLSEKFGHRVNFERNNSESEYNRISKQVNHLFSIRGLLMAGLLFLLFSILYTSVISIFRTDEIKH